MTTTMESAATEDHALFAENRAALVGLAYRLLGSRADAEDAVQDTFLQWLRVDRAEIRSPAAWLTTTCTRRCLDLLRSAHRSRVDYVGPWLPEPLPTSVGEAADERLALASSLTTAFLLLLERLTPKERAAFLLREVFDVPYPEIAQTLDLREDACRKLVSRARANVSRSRARHVAPVTRQRQLLTAFQSAISGGGMDELTTLLSDDIELCTDSGGKAPAVLRVMRGRDEVVQFIAGTLRKFWEPCEWVEMEINGARGIVIRHDGEVKAAATFAYDESGAVTNIFIMRNPEKLAGLA